MYIVYQFIVASLNLQKPVVDEAIKINDTTVSYQSGSLIL